MKTNETNSQAFDKISRQITRDKNLSDAGYRLMMLIINNSTEWKIQLTYYKNLLGWSKNKLAKTTAHLEELGYLSRTKINKGSLGFEYKYTINQNPNKDEIKPLEQSSQPIDENIPHQEIKAVIEEINEHKEEIKERFLMKFKFAPKDRTLNSGEIAQIFNNEYDPFQLYELGGKFTINDFEKFYSTIIRLDKLLTVKSC